MTSQTECKFEIVIKKEWDGDYETNRLDDIEDRQCDVCLDWVISDWYVVKSFKKHPRVQRVVCFDCCRSLVNNV